MFDLIIIGGSAAATAAGVYAARRGLNVKIITKEFEENYRNENSDFRLFSKKELRNKLGNRLTEIIYESSKTPINYDYSLLASLHDKEYLFKIDYPVYIKKNDIIYEGYWNLKKMQTGYGTLYLPSGEIVSSVFKDGKIVSKISRLFYNNETIYEGKILIFNF